ncbi:amidophosphoribosyltransferase [Clostridium saccharoperbutylacetonicum]|uniref:Amidophosphoribosyltransferase n=1 Tax=Clostridium saccharoperbutylacetonicum N1-4(HMT) TaxID=931276 RepID=M1MDC9_9CLOT|nr:amidophosphoribosyltransferase [Clostridium saccharoperbutylacetonicum]AGF55929.1 amidophosphoribosyltransferase PurF [Clostridium saccharoperbutylacetonicum N1-4(HMT)]NRT63332.1 amidophosphoribosyltransferase [Clostridium saccharoperbutylacetonicum]NSB26694.1 amidophosphoribosyltransferase [Clostridium saccharoperbutylacetonicum]NSB46044.1 amidophosphoribosyltransferase [Clostridium saccharoperbutylacetonicum]
MNLEIDDKLKEECGVFGAIDFSKELNCSELTYYGLYSLQHRGQQSCGIAVHLQDKIKYHKELGTVSEVFNEDLLNDLKGNLSIGHVRYATNGQNSSINAQPFIIANEEKKLAIAHNGHILNTNALKSQLTKYKLNSSIDSEVLGYLILKEQEKGISIENSILNMMDNVKGAYSLIIMTKDKLIGVRDPLGMRPLCIGKLNNSYIIASESCALDSIGAEFIRDVEQGEVVTIDKEGIRSIKKQVKEQKKLCVFEFIYFAREDSKIDGISVYKAREAIGRELAKLYNIDADLVVGVPDSGIPAALSYAKESGVPYGQGFVKNKYIGRTFIQSTQSERIMSVKIKLNPIEENIKGKRLILIDDSLVRGTTLKCIVKQLKGAGAKEVHVIIAAPPIKFSCFYGVATSNNKELIAYNKSIDDIKKYISADSLNFMSIENLLKSVRKQNNKCEFCTACFNGDYPYLKEVQINLAKKLSNF